MTAAREAADDLTSVASQFRTSALLAYAKHAVGSVELAAGDPGAVRTLRDAVRRWSEVGSTYRAAAARLVLAEALSAAGRRQDAVIEAGAARDVLVELGATPDVRSADDLLSALT